jgi:asparaginyl-tRNA synthetase
VKVRRQKVNCWNKNDGKARTHFGTRFAWRPAKNAPLRRTAKGSHKLIIPGNRAHGPCETKRQSIRPCWRFRKLRGWLGIGHQAITVMKKVYIKDLLNNSELGAEKEILGWVASKRQGSKSLFVDLVDSTGRIQAVFNVMSACGTRAKAIPAESSVRVEGKVKEGRAGALEIEATNIEILGPGAQRISPRPRSRFDVFDPRLVNRVLSRRHMYVRNDKMSAVLKFRSALFHAFREWFRAHTFFEVHCPVITELPLYEDPGTTFHLDYFGRGALLTQCVAFYLESAVHALERVYSASPSFRAEESSGKRYLAEYWHIKAEVAFASLEDIIGLVENMVPYVLGRLNIDARSELESLGARIDAEGHSSVPYPRISYSDAVRALQGMGINKQFGRSLSEDDETCLSKEFNTPFWITGMPRAVEPFPYRIDPTDQLVTITADLVAPNGYGEILGAAEKIWESKELLERMAEKGLVADKKYAWYAELRESGSVPHSGFGMGVERMIRWLLRLNHVRDAIAFPRLHRRRPSP